jgi:hypothetical protein
MSMLKSVLMCVLLAGPTLVTAQEPLPPPFPRQNATKLMENDRIVVWNIVWPKGQPTALHRHVYDQVGTYYARGGRVITTPDGNARQAMTEVGSLSTTRKGTTHVEEGTTDPPLRSVFIELKRDGPASTTAEDLPSHENAKQLLDDARVRVWDIAALHEDVMGGTPGGTVVVYLGTGRIRVLPRAGRPEELAVTPGTMRYLAPDRPELQAAVEGSPRVMVFELK